MNELLKEFNGFKPNTRAHALFYLRTAVLHGDAHSVIQARLDHWVNCIEAVPGLREKLLTEIEGVAA
jgi:hypothetical protein